MSSLKRNIAQLASGTLASQLLLLIATPALTRLYSPEAFGGLALFMTIYGLFAGIGTLRYELAIPAPRSQKQAQALSAITLVCAGSIASVTCLFVTAGFAAGAAWLPPEYFFLPGCMVLVALLSVAQQWAARDRHYPRYAYSLLLSSAANVSVTLVMGHFGYPHTIGLVAGVFVGVACAAVLMLLPSSSRHHALGGLSWITSSNRLLATARRFSAFPKFMLPTFLFSTATSNAPILVFAILRSQYELGLYSLALKFVMTPSAIIGGAIGEAMRAEMFGRSRQNVSLKPLVDRVVGLGLLVGLPVLALAMAFGGDVLVFILGSPFSQAGSMVAPVAIVALSSFISQPLQAVFMALKKQSEGLMNQVIVGTVPNIALIPLAISPLTFNEILFYYSIVYAIVSAVSTMYIYKIIRRHESHAAIQ